MIPLAHANCSGDKTRPPPKRSFSAMFALSTVPRWWIPITLPSPLMIPPPERPDTEVKR